jgi:hypothetical protein
MEESLPMTDASGNRTDLLSKPPGELPDDAYGEQAARERQQAALPMGRPRPPVLAPTTRPNEPVTAGLPLGPGPGASPLPGRQDTTIARLRALVQASRDPQLAILLGRLESRER